MRSLLVKLLGTEIRINQAKHRSKALVETSVEIKKKNIAFQAVQSKPKSPQIVPHSN